MSEFILYIFIYKMIYDLIERSTYIYTPDMDTPPPNLLTFFSFAQALSKALKKMNENPGIEIENFF